MNTIAYSCRIAALGLVVAGTACGRSATAPTPASPTSGPFAGQTTYIVVNGWSREPVAGATVTANGGDVLTDASGQVQFQGPASDCLTITVRATGFLERRTCGTYGREITLWPATDDEREATHRWIFDHDQISGEHWSVPIDIALAPELAARADIVEAWRGATDAITEVSQRRIRFQWVTTAPEEGLLVVAGDAPLSCSVAPPWPIEVGGFCVRYDPHVYYLDRLQVSPERLTDRGTAMRALLSGVGIRAHSLSGLMSATRPESDLSEYERGTLGMLGLRPRTVMWPDFD